MEVLVKLILSSFLLFPTHGFKIFQLENGSFVFCRRSSLLHVPDNSTLFKLVQNRNISSIPFLDTQALLQCINAAPSLVARDNSRDEAIRVKVQEADLASPSSFIILIKRLSGFYLNPCIAFINKRILITWRAMNDNAVLSYGWLDMETMAVERIINRPDNYFMGGAQTSQEDVRIIIGTNNSIISVYTGNFGLRRKAKAFLSIGAWNDSDWTLSFESSVFMKYGEMFNQKNWIPFYYNESLLFIYSLVPLTVLRMKSQDENYVGEMEVFSVNSLQNKSYPLPWKGDKYGSEIRGGSTAVFVNNGYLLFFHTLSMDFAVRNYFMGAMHLCPNPPFKIRAMSSYPIVKSDWYEGSWVLKNTIDYVVFPVGLALDPDKTHVWLSYGRQDHIGEIAKLEIKGLLDSLENVTTC